MRLASAPTTLLSALVASVGASRVQVNNFCTVSHWITVLNSTWQGDPSWELRSGVAYWTPVVGKGNSLGVTTTNTYWDKDTPKLILGYTSDAGQLWWSINSQDGEPFDPNYFNVTSPSAISDDACGHTVGYEAKNHNCKDDGVVLTLNLCHS